MLLSFNRLKTVLVWGVLIGSAPLLVVGCGARSVFLPPPLRAGFKAAGVALEVVDTGAACRIYNVLLAESRKVGAALIPL